LQRIFGKSDAFESVTVVIKAVLHPKDVMMQLNLINFKAMYLDKAIKDGGNGTSWECSCKSFQQNNTCKHLKCIFSYTHCDKLNLLVDSGFFSLTRDGKNFYIREGFIK
jgi:hypothetical protein